MKFAMWSVFHIIMIIMPIVFTVIMYLSTKKSTYKQKRIIGIVLSIAAIVILLLRNIEIFVENKEMTPELIPFQICHFANFVLLFAFLRDSKPLFLVSFAFNLPAAILALVFANSLENYHTIINFRGFAYLMGHTLIIFLGLWALIEGFVVIKKKYVLRGFLFLTLLYIISIPVNSLFNFLMPNHSSNYFYSIYPEGGTPLEFIYKFGKEVTFLKIKFNPIYILLTLMLAAVVYSVFLIMGYLVNIKKRKKTQIIT